MQTSSNLTKNRWQFELTNALKTPAEVAQFFELPSPINTQYKTLIPLKFAEKIKLAGPHGPLWKQFIPSEHEEDLLGLKDPIGDLKMAKGHGIIHRYKSRVLFTPTTFCPIICRYCFRKNQLNGQDEIFKQNKSALKAYLINHPGVNEVILTGGDPLMLNNNKLIELFEMLQFLGIKFLRIHTRTPIILPNRINPGFVNLLKNFQDKFTKIIFALHVNHKSEIDEEVFAALNKLKGLQIKKLTQTVLLREVNDSKKDLL